MYGYCQAGAVLKMSLTLGLLLSEMPQIARVLATGERAGVAHVGIVPAEQPTVLRIGGLGKHAQVLGDAPGQEHRCLLQLGVVVAAEAVRWRLHLCLGRVGERLHQHRRQRHLAALAHFHGVTHQLELATERRELWTEAANMAGRARQLRLTGKRRHRHRVAGAQQQAGGQHQRDQSKRRPESSTHPKTPLRRDFHGSAPIPDMKAAGSSPPSPRLTLRERFGLDPDQVDATGRRHMRQSAPMRLGHRGTCCGFCHDSGHRRPPRRPASVAGAGPSATSIVPARRRSPGSPNTCSATGKA